MTASYWADKPVKIIDEVAAAGQIEAPEDIINSMSVDIEVGRRFLQHTIYWASDATSSFFKLSSIMNFINSYYITSNDLMYKLHYTKDLLKYYCDDPNAFIMEFTFLSNPDLVIGYVIGKKETLEILGKQEDCIEVNFLCLRPKYRRRGLVNFMMNALAYESWFAYGIGVAHYTVSVPINSPHYCQKKVYHRPLNIPCLARLGFFSKDVNVDVYKKYYNTFIASTENIVEAVTDDSDKHLINYLYTKYLEYCRHAYDVYEIPTEEKFMKVFAYTSFYNFIVKDSNTNTIIAYVCMYRLDIKNTDLYVNNKYKNGNIYYMFFSSSDTNEIIDSLELIFKYVHAHKIFDIITFTDIFPFKKYNKIIEGSGDLKYFLFNYSVPEMDPCRNGLVTI